jgi:hypothetical protein
MPLDARAILRAIVSPITGRMDQGHHIPCDQSCSSAPVKGSGHSRSPQGYGESIFRTIMAGAGISHVPLATFD